MTYLQEKQISCHPTTSYRHTGNSDIERLHGTLNEQIATLKESQKVNERTFYVDLEYEALYYYNNVIHLTTMEIPSTLHFSSNTELNTKTHEMTLQKKRKTLKYRNKTRKDKDINPEIQKQPKGKKKRKS